MPSCPAEVMKALHQVLLLRGAEMMDLGSENVSPMGRRAAIKEPAPRNQRRWLLGKSTLSQVREDPKQDVGLSKDCHIIADCVWSEAARKVQEKEEEISSLTQALQRQRLKTETTQKQVDHLKSHFLSAADSLEERVKSHYSESRRELACREEELNRYWENRMEEAPHQTSVQLEMYKDANKALSHNLVNLIAKEVETETQWKEMFTALEVQLTVQQAEQEDSWKREQELQNQKKKAEEEWQIKTSTLEEEILLFKAWNSELQKLAVLSDSDKEKIKKKEEREQKEEEKRQKKERKEREKKEEKAKEAALKKERRERKDRERMARKKSLLSCLFTCCCCCCVD